MRAKHDCLSDIVATWDSKVGFQRLSVSGSITLNLWARDMGTIIRNTWHHHLVMWLYIDNKEGGSSQNFSPNGKLQLFSIIKPKAVSQVFYLFPLNTVFSSHIGLPTNYRVGGAHLCFHTVSQCISLAYHLCSFERGSFRPHRRSLSINSANP